MIKGLVRFPVDMDQHDISSPYGWRKLQGKDQFHDGIDFTGKDRKIYAIADGVCIYDFDHYNPAHRWDLGTPDSIGNAVILVHTINGRKLFVRYCHPETNFLSVGDHVKAGDCIAVYGDVGYSFGPHIHIDCYDEGWTKLNIANVVWPDVPEAWNRSEPK